MNSMSLESPNTSYSDSHNYHSGLRPCGRGIRSLCLSGEEVVQNYSVEKQLFSSKTRQNSYNKFSENIIFASLF